MRPWSARASFVSGLLSLPPPADRVPIQLGSPHCQRGIVIDEPLIQRSGSIQYPLESFTLFILFVHPHFGMQKYLHSSN